MHRDASQIYPSTNSLVFASEGGFERVLTNNQNNRVISLKLQRCGENPYENQLRFQPKN